MKCWNCNEEVEITAIAVSCNNHHVEEIDIQNGRAQIILTNYLKRKEKERCRFSI